jgi:hypothetical protein
VLFDCIKEVIFFGVDELVASNSIAKLASVSVAPSEHFSFLRDKLDKLVAASDCGELLILKAFHLDRHKLIRAEFSSEGAGEPEKRFEPTASMTAPSPD